MTDDDLNVVCLRDAIEQKQKKSADCMFNVVMIAASESNYNERLSAFFSKLAQSQEPLGDEFEKILNDNFYDLCVSD